MNNTLHKVIHSIESTSHELTIAENGALTIRDEHSLSIGDDEHPQEFARLPLPVVRALRDLLNRPDVAAILG